MVATATVVDHSFAERACDGFFMVLSVGDLERAQQDKHTPFLQNWSTSDAGSICTSSTRHHNFQQYNLKFESL